MFRRSLPAVMLGLIILPPSAGFAGEPCQACQKPIVVNVPAPEITIRQEAAPVVVERAGLLRCSWPHRTHAYVVPAVAQPIAAPVAAASLMPAATFMPAAPIASFAAMPSYGALNYGALAAPFSLQPAGPAMLHLSLAAPVAAPAASTPTASAPTLAASVPGGDINQALQRITGQMETLTRIIDRHTTVLTAHETRLQRMEDYLAKPISERDKAALPLPKAQP